MTHRDWGPASGRLPGALRCESLFIVCGLQAYQPLVASRQVRYSKASTQSESAPDARPATVDRRGPADVVALREVDAVRAQQPEREFVLHKLGDGLLPEPAGDLNNRLDRELIRHAGREAAGLDPDQCDPDRGALERRT